MIAAIYISLMLLTAHKGVATSTVEKNFAPHPSPDGTSVVYYSYRGSKPDIFLLDLKSKTETQLTDTPERWEIEPHFSPDGSKLMYPAGPDMGSLRAHIYDIQADNETILKTLNGPPSPASWLPDSSGIAYFSFECEESYIGLAITKLNGSHICTALNLPSKKVSAPILSIDMRTLVFSAETEEGWDLFSIRLTEGSTATRLTTTKGRESNPNWHYESGYLTYTQKDDPKGVYGIKLFPDGTRREPPIQLVAPEGQHVNFFAVLSADNKWLYYDTSRDNRSFAIMRLRLETRDVELLR